MRTKIENVEYKGYAIEVSKQEDAEGIFYSCFARHETMTCWASGAFTEQEGKDAVIEQVKIYIDKYLEMISHEPIR